MFKMFALVSLFVILLASLMLHNALNGFHTKLLFVLQHLRSNHRIKCSFYLWALLKVSSTNESYYAPDIVFFGFFSLRQNWSSSREIRLSSSSHPFYTHFLPTTNSFIPHSFYSELWSACRKQNQGWKYLSCIMFIMSSCNTKNYDLQTCILTFQPRSQADVTWWWTIIRGDMRLEHQYCLNLAASHSSTSVMYLQTIIFITISCLSAGITAYRDDMPMQKWSPEYFQYRFFPSQSTYKRRMPSYVQVKF